jgi:hypothetical protein
VRHPVHRRHPGDPVGDADGLGEPLQPIGLTRAGVIVGADDDQAPRLGTRVSERRHRVVDTLVRHEPTGEDQGGPVVPAQPQGLEMAARLFPRRRRLADRRWWHDHDVRSPDGLAQLLDRGDHSVGQPAEGDGQPAVEGVVVLGPDRGHAAEQPCAHRHELRLHPVAEQDVGPVLPEPPGEPHGGDHDVVGMAAGGSHLGRDAGVPELLRERALLQHLDLRLDPVRGTEQGEQPLLRTAGRGRRAEGRDHAHPQGTRAVSDTHDGPPTSAFVRIDSQK